MVKLRALLVTSMLALFLADASAAVSAIKVNDQNGEALQGAVVLLTGKRLDDDPPPPRYVMDQVNKQFFPQVLVVPVNSAVDFPNNDDTRHHVYSFSDAKTFELRLYHANEAEPVLFDKAGLVKIGCNIHDSMRAYILVTEKEVFGYSDANGVYTLPALQSAPTSIEVWHPQLDDTVSFTLDQSAEEFLVTLPVVPTKTSPPEKKSSLEDRLKRYKRDAQ
jgi:hypothetical protein